MMLQELYPGEIDARLERAQRNPWQESDLDPSLFEGAASGTGMGLMRGGVRLTQTAGLALAVPAMAVDRIRRDFANAQGEPLQGDEGTELQDAVFHWVRERDNAMDYWTPRPRDVGFAGKALGGLAEIALPLALLRGNPTALIASEQMGTAKRMVDEGVDADTALNLGAATGAVTAAGFRIPFYGQTLARKMAIGAGTNVGLGAGLDAVTAGTLEADGYEQLAEQYNPADIERRTIEALIGAAFGGVAQLSGQPAPRLRDAFAAAPDGSPLRQLFGDALFPDGAYQRAKDTQALRGRLDAAERELANMLPSQRGALLAANNLLHAEQTTAPGRPADNISLTRHAEALEKATEQLRRDEPVDVADIVLRARFDDLDQRTAYERAELRRVTREAIEAQQQAMNPVTANLVRRLDDFEGAVREYSALADSRGGTVLNTDLARELSPEYRANRTLSADVHEPASGFIKRLYAEKLAQPTPAGKDPVVLFTAGGTGAGKTSGQKAMGEALGQPEIIYDTNMNTLDSAAQKIDQALAAGREVEIMYVYSDPVESFKRALDRASRMEAREGSGRTVPVNEHVKTHAGSSQVVRQLIDQYGDKIKVIGVDNARAAGDPRVADIDSLPRVADNNLKQKLLTELEQARESGQISEAVYRGFRGQAEALPRAGLGTGSRGRNAGKPAEDDSAGRTRGRRSPEDPDVTTGREADSATDYEVTAARQVIDELPDISVATGELNADGSPALRSARELLEESDNAITQAEADRNAYRAAADCLLRGPR